MPDAVDLSKVSKRDKALVTILENMVKQLYIQDSLLKELSARHDKVSGTLDDSVFQSNLSRDEVDTALKKLHDSFNRYRSDMITFVREQDIIRSSVDSTQESVKKIAYDVENAGRVVSKIEAQVERQSEALNENITFTNQQWENLPLEFIDTKRNISELHANMENYFDHLRSENEAHVKKIQSETTRRLLVLDDMINALDILLIRTTPPEKKPFIFIRVFRVVGRTIKKAFNRFLKNIRDFFTKKLPSAFKKQKKKDE